MEIIADILLAAGAIAAGLYCMVLGRRLKRFNDLEKGVGGAVAVLSAQVDDLTKTLAAAQKTAAGSADTLNELSGRAEGLSKTLELQLASLHDMPTPTNGVNTSSENGVAAGHTNEPMFVRHRAAEVRQ